MANENNNKKNRHKCIKRALLALLLLIVVAGASLFSLDVRRAACKFSGNKFCLLLPPTRGIDSSVYSYINGTYQCPSGTEKALTQAGLEPTVPIKCRDNRALTLNEDDTKIVDVFYKKKEFYNAFEKEVQYNGMQSVPVLSISDQTFYVFPHRFTDKHITLKKITEKLKTPFMGSWSNFDLDTFSEKRLIEKSDQFCIEYSFKFPFRGNLEHCPRPDVLTREVRTDSFYYGDISYQEGAFQWMTALSKVIEECPKHSNSHCKFLNTNANREEPYFHWGGSSDGTAIKISDGSEKKIEYYLFSTHIYHSGGSEEQILVQVFPDGTTRSKLIPRRSYKAEGLFKLEKEIW